PSNTETFGLIQEELQHNLYHLIVQAILWNQTRGKQARPILNKILSLYPTPGKLAYADESFLTDILSPIGLHKQRAKRLIAMAQEWQRVPPKPNQLFKARAPGYESGSDPANPGWEIAHLPGVGPYALDSFRIFHRDQLLGLSKGWQADPNQDAAFEPEWKRVVPLDKDLRAFLRWAWQKEGYEWDPLTG
ncbi:DNA glycosylase, partial [Meira miltonrushii]